MATLLYVCILLVITRAKKCSNCYWRVLFFCNYFYMVWCWAMAIWSSNLGVSAENGKMMVAGDESVVWKCRAHQQNVPFGPERDSNLQNSWKLEFNSESIGFNFLWIECKCSRLLQFSSDWFLCFEFGLKTDWKKAAIELYILKWI